MGFKLKRLRRPAMAIGTMGGSEIARALAGGRNANAASLGSVGGPNLMGGVVGARQDRNAATAAANAPKTGVVPKAIPGGMTNFYDDSWGALQGVLNQGGGYEDAISQILQNFKGKPSDLENFMRQSQPFLGAIEAKNIRGSDAFKYMSDQGNWDQGAMAGYGTAAGMIGQNAARQTMQGQNALASQGLGRSSARAALGAQAQQQAAAQQGDLWSRTFQQAQQNRWNSAQGLLDTHRMIAQMALGQQITPRQPQEGSTALQSGAAIAGGLGGLLTGIGALGR